MKVETEKRLHIYSCIKKEISPRVKSHLQALPDRDHTLVRVDPEVGRVWEARGVQPVTDATGVGVIAVERGHLEDGITLKG